MAFNPALYMAIREHFEFDKNLEWLKQAQTAVEKGTLTKIELEMITEQIEESMGAFYDFMDQMGIERIHEKENE